MRQPYPASRSRPHRGGAIRRGGHTLVETLIVMALMAALAGMAMPRLNYVSIRLDANVRVVRAVFQQAWRTAVQKQHDVLVSVDTAGQRIRMHEDVNNDGLMTAGERITWRPLEEGAAFDVPPAGVNGPVTAAVLGTGVSTVASLPTITFRRNGAAGGDAEIYISATNRGLKEWRAVTVAQATGRTEWFRRPDATWRSGGI